MWLPRIFRIRCIGRDLRWRSRFHGGRRHEIPADVSNTHSDRRWSKAGAHRLYGLEGPCERARSAKDLSTSGEGSADRRVSRAVEESGKARFRVVGRIRAKFRGTPDSVRTYQRDSVLGEGAGGG